MNFIRVLRSVCGLDFKPISVLLFCMALGACSSIQKQASTQAVEDDRGLKQNYQAVLQMIKETEFKKGEDSEQVLQEALATLEKINSDYPFYPGPLVNLGVVSWRLDKLAEAKGYFSQVTNLDSQLKQAADADKKLIDSPDAKLSAPLLEPGKVDDILQNLPSFKLKAYNYLGLIARTEGDFDGAESAYRSALAIDAEFLPALRNLAILLDLYRGEIAQALPLYERYQGLLAEPDAQVKDWIFDIKSRL
jgi:tetratricopeptide (TPR) repeat protein